MTTAAEDQEDNDKLQSLKDFIDTEDCDEHLTEWEINFIEDQALKSSITDREFSDNESEKVDEIYQKLWNKGLL